MSFHEDRYNTITTLDKKTKAMRTLTLLLISCITILSACKSGTIETGELPAGAVLGLPDGIELTSLVILGPDEVTVGTTERAFEIEFELSAPLPADSPIRIIPVLVRDVEAIRGAPLAANWFGILPGQGDGSRANIFKMICEDGKVAGRTNSTFGDADLSDFNRSSGERSTRIFLQHAEETRELGNLTVGVIGLESNRIRVTCE